MFDTWHPLWSQTKHIVFPLKQGILLPCVCLPASRDMLFWVCFFIFSAAPEKNDLLYLCFRNGHVLRVHITSFERGFLSPSHWYCLFHIDWKCSEKGVPTPPSRANGHVQVCNYRRRSNFRVSRFALLGQWSTTTTRGGQPPYAKAFKCVGMTTEDEWGGWYACPGGDWFPLLAAPVSHGKAPEGSDCHVSTNSYFHLNSFCEFLDVMCSLPTGTRLKESGNTCWRTRTPTNRRTV
jgi:hypothetical protein